MEKEETIFLYLKDIGRHQEITETKSQITL